MPDETPKACRWICNLPLNHCFYTSHNIWRLMLSWKHHIISHFRFQYIWCFSFHFYQLHKKRMVSVFQIPSFLCILSIWFYETFKRPWIHLMFSLLFLHFTRMLALQIYCPISNFYIRHFRILRL